MLFSHRTDIGAQSLFSLIQYYKIYAHIASISVLFGFFYYMCVIAIRFCTDIPCVLDFGLTSIWMCWYIYIDVCVRAFACESFFRFRCVYSDSAYLYM